MASLDRVGNVLQKSSRDIAEANFRQKQQRFLQRWPTEFHESCGRDDERPTEFGPSLSVLLSKVFTHLLESLVPRD